MTIFDVVVVVLVVASGVVLLFCGAALLNGALLFIGSIHFLVGLALAQYVGSKR